MCRLPAVIERAFVLNMNLINTRLIIFREIKHEIIKIHGNCLGNVRCSYVKENPVTNIAFPDNTLHSMGQYGERATILLRSYVEDKETGTIAGENHLATVVSINDCTVISVIAEIC